MKTAFFQREANKRLTSGSLILKTSSNVRCAVFCLTSNDCVAASVTIGDDGMLCNLATKITGPDDLVEDAGSHIFVKDTYFQGRNSKLKSSQRLLSAMQGTDNTISHTP